MTRMSSSTGTASAPATSAAQAPTRSPSSLMPFVAAALGIGAPLLALSTVITPGAPFVLAAMLFGLAIPALVLTRRESGRAGVRALLRDCVRLPSSWWWLPLAGFGLPVVTWTTGAALDGAQPLTLGLVGVYVGDLIINALIINILEEMAWTGYFQRRAASRWGAVGGSLVTSVFFTAIHVPLALHGATGAKEIATNLLYLAGVAVAVRLLIDKSRSLERAKPVDRRDAAFVLQCQRDASGS